FPADLRQRPVQDAVAGGGDAHELRGLAAGGEQLPDALGLPDRERALARPDPQRAHLRPVRARTSAPAWGSPLDGSLTAAPRRSSCAAGPAWAVSSMSTSSATASASGPPCSPRSRRVGPCSSLLTMAPAIERRLFCWRSLKGPSTASVRS